MLGGADGSGTTELALQLGHVWHFAVLWALCGILGTLRTTFAELVLWSLMLCGVLEYSRYSGQSTTLWAPCGGLGTCSTLARCGTLGTSRHSRRFCGPLDVMSLWHVVVLWAPCEGLSTCGTWVHMASRSALGTGVTLGALSTLGPLQSFGHFVGYFGTLQYFGHFAAL